MAKHRGRQNQKQKEVISFGFALPVLALLACTIFGGCALGPVESDPERAAERNAMMRADCYKRGGIWYEDKGVCVAADNPR